MEQWQYEHIVSQLHRTYRKRHENFVLGALIHDEVIGELLVFTQHYVRFKTEGYALVDIFYPQLDIAIEVDEPLHQNFRESDRKREQQLKETLACDVIRIDVASGNIYDQVKLLREELVNRMNQLRSSGKWKPWTEPPSISFDKLRAYP